LRLIKGQKIPDSQIYVPATSEIKGPKNSLALKQAIIAEVRKYLTPEYVHKFILAAFVFSGLYLLISLSYLVFGLNRAVLPKIESGKAEQLKSSGAQIVKKPLDYYLEGTKARSLFISEAAGQGQAPGVLNAELVKDINLMGIISGDNPQVIIEDKKNQKTYYVNKGQYFGDFLVEDIQAGKVVLNYKGQRFELYL